MIVQDNWKDFHLVAFVNNYQIFGTDQSETKDQQFYEMGPVCGNIIAKTQMFSK